MRLVRQLAYGFLGLPLAMAALPVYVQIPNYYTSQLGLPLASTGLILFLARLMDTAQDPFLGRIIDRIQVNNKFWLVSAGLLLAISFLGLWLPPDPIKIQTIYLQCWLGFMLILAYTAHSMLNIAYLAWGSRLTETNKPQLTSDPTILGASAWREGFGLIGVISASLIPSWIFLQDATQISRYLHVYSIAFCALVMIGLTMLLGIVHTPARQPMSAPIQFGQMWNDRPLRRLMSIYFFNSLSVSIPATLVLFFITDQIQAPEKTGLFLACYFVAGALGLPLWIQAAKKWGTARCWKLGMIVAVLSFIGAALLGKGDALGFLFVCLCSGFALGADLAFPPVLLTETVNKYGNSNSQFGSYFGVWSLLGKLSLAIAGLSLPLLQVLGFQSVNSMAKETQTTSQISLTLCYALIPCLCKLLAYHLLRAPLHSTPTKVLS